MSIEELKAQLDDKKRAFNAIRTGIDNETADAVAEARERVSAKYAEALSAATKELCAAEILFNEKKDAEAAAGEGALLPIGEMYEEWDYPGGWRYNGQMQRTGRRAVVELFRQGDNYRGNRKPEIGDTVLRELKKDGSRAVTCHVIHLINWGEKKGSAEPPLGWRKVHP